MRKLTIIVLFLLPFINGYSQVVKLPSSVNMTNSNGVAYNTASLDLVTGIFEIGQFPISNFKYRVVNMTPSFSLKKQTYEVVVVDLSNVLGEKIKYSLTINDKVIEKLSKIDSFNNPEFTISK